MDRPASKRQRCAIYTRKSTDHNLDLEFNSLDAQREACEAYIKSQAHEGWKLVPARYDDGAFSGASLERPALQALLAEVTAGRIDVIVVYKVDRLTRSLADFAKLVDLFDRHGVSFVSITQSFNTTTSMGRLTLNVLLSFAQFEREVIGERVRDKIAASKAKGLWTGGTVPLGYASIGKKLVIVPNEAQTVRSTFQRYLELGSIGALAEDLDRQGIRTKRQELSNRQIRGGIRFGVGALGYLLRNRLYIGEVAYRGTVHSGEHEPILDRALFEAVQARLSVGATTRRNRLKASPALLMGCLYDDRGNRMTPSHSNKKGVRYRYYVSHALLQKRPDQAGSIARISAPDIEHLVVTALRNLERSTDAPNAAPSDQELIERHVERVVLRPKTIEVHRRVHDSDDGQETDDTAASAGRSTCISIPWTAQPSSAAKGILHAPSSEATIDPVQRDKLLGAIAKARTWIDDLTTGRAASFNEIAKREGKVERHVRFLAPLAFVSPHIVTAIADGSASAHLTVTTLAKALPHSWAEQERQFGIARQ